MFLSLLKHLVRQPYSEIICKRLAIDVTIGFLSDVRIRKLALAAVENVL
jgi:hypothetical protein